MCEKKVGKLTTNARRHRINALKRSQGMQCCYCECTMVEVPRVDGVTPPKDSLTLEHLKRIEDGGTHNMDNLALACFECNYYRGNIDWFTYKSYRMGELWAA